MNNEQILLGARELLSDPEKWYRDGYALAADGSACQALSAEAVKWCALGAADYINGDFCMYLTDKLLDDAARELGYRNTIDLNTRADHATVLAMFDRALQLIPFATTSNQITNQGLN